MSTIHLPFRKKIHRVFRVANPDAYISALTPATWEFRNLPL